MEKLKLKATAEGLIILFGFYLFGVGISLFFDKATAELFRLVLLEWGAFPMLSAIVGGVVSSKNGFMPLYGLGAGIIFSGFMLLCFEVNWYLALAHILLGYLGSLYGHYLYLKEVKRIEEGKPKKVKRSIIFSLFDRYDTKKYK